MIFLFLGFIILKYILSIFLTNFESVLSLSFLSQYFEAVKEFHNFSIYILIYTTTLNLLFFGNQVRKTHVNVYQQFKFNYTHHLFFQFFFNLSLSFEQVSKRIIAYY